MSSLEARFAADGAAWRDPQDVVAQWQRGDEVDPRAFDERVRGDWWGVLEELGITLLMTREYEHLVLAYSVQDGQPRRSHLVLPHPGGIAFDPAAGRVSIAATRNPNQVFELAPVVGAHPRSDMPAPERPDRPLVPVTSQFLPGSLYMHDLAFIGGRLHANAVGHNAVVALPGGGHHERVWWPRAAEDEAGRLIADRNVLQLNSIAAGEDLDSSYFSASTDRPSARRPGSANFPVDGRGVVFSGRTRDVVARGLTRPHSARLHRGRVWVANSGYGELGVIEEGGLRDPLRLPGWTRGLCFSGDIAFVGTSRVIKRFRQYAPGLDVDGSVCGVHAIDVGTGRVLGSVTWPRGNQIYAIEPVPASLTSGFPFTRRRAPERGKRLFYSFTVE